MPCKQNEYLLSRHVYVDLFRRDSEVVFLTHAHSDHTDGLLRHANRVSICCTFDTAKILSIRYGLDLNMFQILQYRTPFQVLNDLFVDIYPSYHCIGSCMFHFYTKDKSWSCLYTGDFRWSEDAEGSNNSLLLLPTHVKTLYVDDSYKHFEYPFYSLEKLFRIQWIPIFREIIQHSTKFSNTRVSLNANILGIERLLIFLHKIMKKQIVYRFHRRMSRPRQEEIKWITRKYSNILCEKNFEHDCKSTKKFTIILVDRKVANSIRDDILSNSNTDTFLICPGVYYFTKTGQENKTSTNSHRRIKHVFFATHANKHEINRLLDHVHSDELVYCNDQIL